MTLCGWVNRRRDSGSLIFIDMRYGEGIVRVLRSGSCGRVKAGL
ncbi:hypothetical protein ACLB1R_06975 [Escherichia coli]